MSGALAPEVAVAMVAIPQALAERGRGGRGALAQRRFRTHLFYGRRRVTLFGEGFIFGGARAAAQHQDNQQLSHAQSLTAGGRDATAPTWHDNQGTGSNHSGTP